MDRLEGERLHGLDAVRGGALLLGVALHASMSWLPGAEYFWVTADGARSLPLAVLFHWIHSFRMTLFFVLAGYFACLGLGRRGTAGFIRERVRRLVLPGLVLWLPLLLAVVAVLTWNAWRVHGGPPPAETPPPLTARTLPLLHLWFLYLLALFTTAALVLRAALAFVDRGGRLRARLDRGARRLLPWAPLVVVIPIAAALLSVPVWWAWFGIPTPDTGLLPNRAALVAYGLAFAAGWMLRRHPGVLVGLRRRWPAWLVAAAAASVGGLALIGIQPPSAPAGDAPVDVAYAALHGFSAWAWTFALTGLALRFLDAPSPVRRYVADASYWIYLVHVPLVMALQVAAAGIDAPWWFEFPLVLAVATALLFGSYALLVRGTWIGRALGGPSAAAVSRGQPLAMPAAERS